MVVEWRFAHCDAEETSVACLGLSNAFRGGSSKEGVRIGELTSLRGVQPLLSEGQRREGF